MVTLKRRHLDRTVELLDRTVANKKVIGYTFGAANTDETVLSPASDNTLCVVHLIVGVASGLTSPTLTLKDGTTEIGTWPLTSSEAETILSSSFILPWNGDLVAQVSSTGIEVSVWAVEI